MNNEVATAPAVAVKSTPATIPAAAKTTATASTNAALESLISPLNACFSISLHPLLLGDYVGTYNSGCVVTVSGPETIVGFSSSSFMKMIVSKLQLEIEAVPGKSFAGAVEQLLQREADSLIDVASAAKKYSKSTQPMVVQDELDWFKNSSMRSYAFLRRLAMPMHIHGLGTESKLKQLEFSFLDLLLKLDALKGIAHKCSLSRIRILEKEKAEPSKSCKEIEMLQELHKLLKDTIDRAGVSETNDIIDVCDKKVLFVSYTIPERKREEVLAVRAERKRLLQDLEERKKNQGAEVPHFTVGGKIKLPYRIYNGCLLVTENELSHDGFCSQMKIMAKVNKTLPRPYYPGVSRPKLEKVGLSKDAMHRLRSIFFDLDGSLKDSVAIDIDLSKKHGYINFANSASRDTRNDYRWQVPIQLHSLRGFIDVRAAIESLFSEKKILHPGKEEIHDIGILIGGTEDQSLHHDIPRQTTSWLEKSPKRFKTTGVPIKGWEFDRAAYNESMASPYAPSSILLGMSDSGVVNLGVQKNQIERYE